MPDRRQTPSPSMAMLMSGPGSPMASPNFLFILVDQLGAPFLPTYGHRVVKAPHIEQLGRKGVVFENAYCNFPLGGPSRMSMLTGQLPSRIEAFDNASELPSAVPTMAHYLRLLNYNTILAGKMQFSGADQLHGFEERLTPDMCPADFSQTPDWRAHNPPQPWHPSLLSVAEAGVYDLMRQVDFDENTIFHSVKRIHDIGRARHHRTSTSGDAMLRPFFMLVSLSHPKDPYLTTQEYWDRYNHEDIDMPKAMPEQDDNNDEPEGHSKRIRELTSYHQYDISEDHVRNARHAYYGMISYVDDKIGQLLKALEVTGLQNDTIVVFASDHGDMLGERGLWYPMVFYENSARVPLIISCPSRFNSSRISANVSLLDVMPTLLDIAAASAPPLLLADPIDGHTLLPMLHMGNKVDWPDTVLAEYNAEGAECPVLMIRRGQYKYIYSSLDGHQLFNIAQDPDERVNLAKVSEHASRLETFQEEVKVRWDVDALNAAVHASQRRRFLVQEALRQGRATLWEYRPQDSTQPTFALPERAARMPIKPMPLAKPRGL